MGPRVHKGTEALPHPRGEVSLSNLHWINWISNSDKSLLAQQCPSCWQSPGDRASVLMVCLGFLMFSLMV